MNSGENKTVKIGIVGLGTVGAGTFEIFNRNAAEINNRAGVSIMVTHIGSRSEKPGVDTKDVQLSKNIFDVADDPDVDILVELIGGTTTALELIKRGIDNGKHIVTANKALIAEHGNEIFAQAEKAGVNVAYEAAVAGGIPIIKALREGLAANKIQWLAGIINGTGNFILTEMAEKGRDFSAVLKEAQDLGYAEADPTFDVEGIDAAHKLTILVSNAFGVPLNFDETFTEGISQITTLDLEYAAEFGYRIKHLGIGRLSSQGVEMRVHPTLIPEKNLIAKVDGVMNAVMVNGDALGTSMYYGPGAGAEPTGSSVVADIVDIARLLNQGAGPSVSYLGFHKPVFAEAKFVPIEEVQTSYYLRVQAQEKPGVLADISKILSDHQISIEGIYQKEVVEKDKSVPVIILTQKVVESVVNDALEQITRLECTQGDVVKIRIEHLEG